MAIDWQKLCASKNSERLWDYWDDDLRMGKEKKESIRLIKESIKSILVIAFMRDKLSRSVWNRQKDGKKTKW